MNIQTLRKELINALTVEQAHLLIKSSLENLKPENRTLQPAQGLHSVWELFEHLRITQNDILQYMIIPDWKSPEWPEGYWPKKRQISDEEWNESISKFNDDLQRLISIIKDESIDITSIIPHTKNHTYIREILIVIDHNSYHTAQIVQTRKTIGDWY